MIVSGYRTMWIMVMFDLPTDSKEARRIYSRWRRASLIPLDTAPRTILFGGRFRLLYSTGVFPFRTFPLSEGPTDHRLPNPVGPRILRFLSLAVIIKSSASSAPLTRGAPAVASATPTLASRRRSWASLLLLDVSIS